MELKTDCKTKNTEIENWREEIQAQYSEPHVDLVNIIRARRLRWVGRQLRLTDNRITKKIFLCYKSLYKYGSILSDKIAPDHKSIHDLVTLAGDHKTEDRIKNAWNGRQCATH